MARSYSRITSTIWRDADFVALPPDQKLVYLMLISQADVSPCGLLSVTLRRWARSLGTSQDDLTDALEGLRKGRFILWDEDAEEVFIRSFVKWDGGLSNPNRAKAIIAAVEAVGSDSIFNAAMVELDRLGASHGLIRRETEDSNPVRTPSEAGSNALASPSEGPRVVVTLGDQGEPQPLNLEPAPFARRERDRFDEFWDVYPRKRAKGEARKRWDIVRRRVDQQTLIDAAVRYALEVRDKDPQYTAHAATWLNAGRWEDEPSRAPSRPSTPWAGS